MSFFSKFEVKTALNFDSVNGSKWLSEMGQTGIEILVESNLLVLALSNLAQDFHFIMHELTSRIFFPNCLIGEKLNFDSGQKWSFHTYQTGLQIVVKSKLFRVGSPFTNF